MLQTPFGCVELLFDNKPIEYQVEKAPKDERLYPDVNGAYLLVYSYIADHNNHLLKCIIHNTKAKATAESGERLEAVAIYLDEGKITIGIEGDFAFPDKEDPYDFDGAFIPNGIEIYINQKTKSQCFAFGVAWILPCTDENDVQTWFAADPTVTFSK